MYLLMYWKHKTYKTTIKNTTNKILNKYSVKRFLKIRNGLVSYILTLASAASIQCRLSLVTA